MEGPVLGLFGIIRYTLFRLQLFFRAAFFPCPILLSSWPHYAGALLLIMLTPKVNSLFHTWMQEVMLGWLDIANWIELSHFKLDSSIVIWLLPIMNPINIVSVKTRSINRIRLYYWIWVKYLVNFVSKVTV